MGKAAAGVYLHPAEPAVILGIRNKNLNPVCLEVVTQTVQFIQIEGRALVPGVSKANPNTYEIHCGTLQV